MMILLQENGAKWDGFTRARRMATACSHIEKWPSVQVKPMGVCSHDFVKLDLCSLSLSHISQERLQQMD